MRYLGGKSRIAKKIATEHLLNHPDRSVYVEPFVGGGAVLQRVTAAGQFDRYIVADVNVDLIDMYRAYQAGWRPDTDITEDEYRAYRDAPSSPARTFAGFGCSFGGMFFQGYARSSRGENFALQSSNSLEKAAKAGAFDDNVEYRACSLFDLDLSDVDPADSVVYCDPPYSGTRGYNAVDAFDSAMGWAVYRCMSDAGAAVYVSEYEGPDGLDYVEYAPQASLNIGNKAGGSARAAERLYTL